MSIVKRSNFFPSTSFFDDFMTRNLFDWSGSINEVAMIPKANIAETNENFLVEVAAPGFKKSDFQIELDNDTLTVQTQLPDNSEEVVDRTYTRREFSSNSFKRSFYLPNTVETDHIEAVYSDGVLRLVIPKKEEAKKRPIKTISIS